MFRFVPLLLPNLFLIVSCASKEEPRTMDEDGMHERADRIH